jgi:membrane protease YdiL (CAAX protease family)
VSAVLRERWLWIFALACAASVAVLVAQGAAIEDALVSLLLLGVALPLLTLATTWGLPTPGGVAAWQRGEAATLIGLIVFVAAVLMVKQPLLDALVSRAADARLRAVVNLLLKLLLFVAVPWTLMRARHGRLPAAGTVRASRTRLVLCFVLLSLLAWGLQALLGNEFARLLARRPAVTALALSAVACFAWNCLEAGVVEEFFFRRLLQSRLAAWSGSQVAAIFIGALVFGLAHLPGIWLRGAGSSENLGTAPSLLTTAAYVIVTQGVAGLAFGVLWARTRSLPLLVLLHGMFDTPADLAHFSDVWGL